MTYSPAKERNRLIARIHAEAHTRGLQDADRRALQERATGKASCADMTAPELRRVIAELDRAGDGLAGPLAAKLRALWISGWHLGTVRDRRDTALIAFVKRATGLDAARFAHHARDASKAVEAIKAMLAREAGVDWRPHITFGRAGRPSEIDDPRARVLEAQWRILHHLAVVRSASAASLAAYAAEHGISSRRIDHTELSRREADELIRHLGTLIRRAKNANQP